MLIDFDKQKRDKLQRVVEKTIVKAGAALEIHNDDYHSGSAKRDALGGLAALDASGHLLVKGSAIKIPKDGSEYFYFVERVTGETSFNVKRASANDYDLYIKESNVDKQVQTEGHKNAANGIPGLDGSAKILQAQMPNLEVHSQTPQIVTGSGAIDVTSMITHLVTGGVGADALTLADGVEGQEKIILIKTLTAGGDTTVITPTNFAHGTTITGNAAGSIQNLVFTNGSWHWTGGYGVVIA